MRNALLLVTWTSSMGTTALLAEQVFSLAFMVSFAILLVTSIKIARDSDKIEKELEEEIRKYENKDK